MEWIRLALVGAILGAILGAGIRSVMAWPDVYLSALVTGAFLTFFVLRPAKRHGRERLHKRAQAPLPDPGQHR